MRDAWWVVGVLELSSVYWSDACSVPTVTVRSGYYPEWAYAEEVPVTERYVGECGAA